MPASARDLWSSDSALPISEWNFKEDADTRHLGPMAQYFHAAFGLGTDDKHIATVDANGVALAAIQGLNRKLDETILAQETHIAQLTTTVAELKAMVYNLREELGQGRTTGR